MLHRYLRCSLIFLVAILVGCSTPEPVSPVEVTVISEVETEVTRVVEVVSEVTVETEVTREVIVEQEVTVEVPVMMGDSTVSPAFYPYDDQNPVGESEVWRSADSIYTEFTASDLTVGDAMTLWFIMFNHPEECMAGPFQCGPPDLGSNRAAMGDFVYIDGAGDIVGEDGTLTFRGGLEVDDTSGTGLTELPDGCVPGNEGCGDPVGLTNPDGALIIVALHSHGPAQEGDVLESQLNSYLGGCTAGVIGTLPGGFSASADEIPDAVGECATIQISPHAPAMTEEMNDESQPVAEGPFEITTRAVKTGMMQVFVPAGDFLPNAITSRTKFADAFWIDQTEVTNAQFAEFVLDTGFVTTAESSGSSFSGVTELSVDYTWANPSGGDENAWQSVADHPVVHVSQHDATAFCAWRDDARLPTADEWVKAAGWDDAQQELRAYAWGEWMPGYANYCDANCPISYKDAEVDDGFRTTAPVGTFPNGVSYYGALDMSGNVSEHLATNNADISTFASGAWGMTQDQLRTVARYSDLGDFSADYVGFRCVQEQ